MYKTLAHYYDQLGWNRFSYIRAGLVLEFIKQEAPHVKRVLDVACGTGTFCFLLTDEDFHVTGIDASRDMLAMAKQKAGKRKARNPGFHRRDMRDFDLRSTFDLVTCNFDSINHLLSEKDILSAFRAIASHLKDDGIFIFDANTVSGLRNWKYQDIRNTSDYVMLRHGVFDEKNRTATIYVDAFVKKGRDTYLRFLESVTEKGYTIATLYRLLGTAGFRKIKPIGRSFGKARRALEADPRVVLCARR